MAAVVALGVVQIPLISFADAPAPWVQKADQHKKKKKKAARRAPRRTVQQTQTVTRAPDVPAEVVETPQPVEVVQAPPPPVPPAPPVTPPAAPAPTPAIPAAVASGGGFNLIFPLLGLAGLGALVGALGSSSNG